MVGVGGRREFCFLVAALVSPTGHSKTQVLKSSWASGTQRAVGSTSSTTMGTPGQVLQRPAGMPGALVRRSARGALAATKRVKVYFPLDCSEKPPQACTIPAPLGEVGRRRREVAERGPHLAALPVLDDPGPEDSWVSHSLPDSH